MVALAVALALVAAGCGTTGPAATVNGSEISADALEAELEAIRGNEAYVEAFEQNTQIPVSGQGDGTFSQALLAEVLRIDIIFRLIRQEVQERGIEVPEPVREQARQQALCQLAFVGGPSEECETRGGPILDAFPEAYQDALVERWADALALDQSLREEASSEEAVDAYFDEHPNRYARTCLSHILVPTEEEADEIRGELEGGADFADLAAARSQDPSSAENGGSLDCQDNLTAFVTPFADAAERADVGELTGPVATQFGWHLILVTERGEAPTLDDVRDAVAQDVAGQSDINGWLDEALSTAEVTVDDRYGTWNQGTGQIDPPAGPTTTSTTAPQPFPSVTVPPGTAP